MHHKVGVLTFEKNPEDGYTKAVDIMEQCTGEGFGKFDYFSQPGDNYARFDVHKAIRAEDCSEEIDTLLKESQDDHWFWIEKIQELLKKPRETLDKKEIERISSYGYIMGCKSSAFLLDADGESISSQAHLHNVMTKWDTLYRVKNNPYADDKIWLSTFDVHT